MYVELLYSCDACGELCNGYCKGFWNESKKIRGEKGLSQEELAKKSRLHRTYISAIKCFRRSIALENVQRIADALDIETYKLFLEETL